MSDSRTPFYFFLSVVVVLVFATPANAFGAGNIASIAKIEGYNFRHGDIEDTLKRIVFLGGAKWSSKQIRRVYFGNWLRDYSQALDVGTLKSVNKDSIRCLIWLLSFMSFGYATGEFEVTEDRLGVYRPEEHIDNPKHYADDKNAQVYDKRLRPPIHPDELAVDPLTGMKNYIANETGGWATSSGYVKFSLSRCIHFGRVYTSGPAGQRGREEDLCEALRCLGQALHCLEDFSAHSNYVELVLREIGYRNVFPHTGSMTEMEIGVPQGYSGGRRAFPIVTGTFGSVDFAHSVLGEAQDKFSQTELTEVDEMDNVLAEAQEDQKRSAKSGQGSYLKELLSQLSNTGLLGGNEVQNVDKLEEESNRQEMENMNLNNRPGAFNPLEIIQKIYPILEFRDNIMRVVEKVIESIPGLTALVEMISDTLSIFVFSLLAPFIRPIIAQASLELKEGSSALVDTSSSHQFEPWDDPHCTDPTHSILSKDHFSNRLNTPAGEVAQTVLEFVVPRVLHAWEDVNFPLDVVLNDVIRVFHHPALRDPNCDIQAGMFNTVVAWTERLPDRGASLNDLLSAEGVRQGKNHTTGVFAGSHGGGHSKCVGGEWEKTEIRGAGKKGGKGGGGGGGKSDFNTAIAGLNLPGPVGGILGGILDAGLQGFNDSSQQHGKVKRDIYNEDYSSKSKDKYKEKDYKDKHYKEKDYKEKDYKDKSYKEKDYKEKDYKEKDYKEKDYKEKDYKEKDKSHKKDHKKDKSHKEKDKKKSKNTPHDYNSGGEEDYDRHRHSSRERQRSRDGRDYHHNEGSYSYAHGSSGHSRYESGGGYGGSNSYY